MLALWYNGISARVGRARAAQLYHIFGKLSIGNLHKKQRPFLQGLAFGNEVFCLVEVQQPLNRLAFFLRGAIDIK